MRKVFQCCKCPQWIIMRLTSPTFQDIKFAIWHQQLQKVKQLIQEGVPQHEKGETILHFAVANHKQEAVQFITTNFKEFIDQRNQDGDTPFMLALFLGNMKIIKHLFPISKLNIRDNFGNNVFIIAAANKNLEMLQYLLPLVNPMGKNFQGQTALHRACYYGHIDIIKFLVNQTKLKFGQLDRNNNNSLHLACLGCSIIAVKYIIKKMETPETLLYHKNSQAKTPLDILEQMVSKLNQAKKSKEKYFDFNQIKDYVIKGCNFIHN